MKGSKIQVKNISISDPLYQQECLLRNEVLLRPIGIPDHAWEMNDETSWHFVAIENDKVIGCVVFFPTNKEKTEAQLMQMAVSVDHQGKGIGKMIVDKLKDFSKKQGIKRIICHARDNAVDFYLKQGFDIYGEPFEEVGIGHRHMEYIVHL